MNSCACGCGKLVARTWARGHAQKANPELARKAARAAWANPESAARIRVASSRAQYGRSNPRAVRVERPSLLDIAWAAGLYEGEGCAFRSWPRHKRGTFRMRVGQTDPEILFRLKRFFGGNIGKPRSYDGHHSWEVAGPRARGLAMTFYRFLSTRRREQIRIALKASIPVFMQESGSP